MEFNLNYEKGIIDEIKDVYQNKLVNKMYQFVSTLTVFVGSTKEPISFNDKDILVYHELHVGQSWGALFDCGWFHLTGKVENVTSDMFLKLDISGEALLYDKKGNPVKGFTNGSSVFDRVHGEPGKLYFPISSYIENGELDLWLDAGCNDLFGNLQDNGCLIAAEIVRKDCVVERLYYNIEVLMSLLKTTSRGEELYQNIFPVLRDVKNLILYECQDWLNKSIQMTDAIIFSETSSTMRVTAVGHAHLDLAWLWPIRESKRKAIRTITNVFYLMEKYPEFRFVISQPQQMIWIKQNNTKIYNELKRYIAEGRIELVGGMFVEPDTNVTGEESLVRQALHGMRFYKKEFNSTVKNLWLPDVFGYNGNLPQIIKKSGMDNFMTIKISWSLINKFPHHSMMWEGIDGTQVLTHMPPEGTYNSSSRPDALIYAEKNFAEKHISNDVLGVFGIGDGGGGPGEEHLERIRREKKLPNTPVVEIGRVDQFFQKLSKIQKSLPIWKGELYLENHQGTYTSQSNIKRYNRLIENKLKALETFLVEIDCRKYNEEIKSIWEEIMLYQFHDILPGSSIKRVYVEAIERYQEITRRLDEILLKINSNYTKEYSDNVVFYNHNNFNATKLFKINEEYHEVTVRKMTTKILQKNVYAKEEFEYNGVIKTKNLIIKFNLSEGCLESIYHPVKGKEYLKNSSNRLRVFKDFGDGWNILDHYRYQDEVYLELLSTKTAKYGPIFEIINEYSYQNSKVTEKIIINENDDSILFYHDTNWNNLNTMLRASFDLNIDSDEAICDIQFGNIKRTRRNETSIETAQFEVCAHNWVGITEKNASAAIINNAKYGYYIKDSILELNLLRSTNYPCVRGDLGTTTYSYGLILGDKELNEAKIDEYAMNFNSEYLMFNGYKLNEPFIQLGENIQYSAIKYAYDEDGVIIRLYNSTSKETRTKIQVNLDYKKIYETNLIEDAIKEINLDDELIFSPFEIRTFKIV